MKKSLIGVFMAVTALFLTLPAVTLADGYQQTMNSGVQYAQNQNTGGFTGPSLNQISVAEVKQLSDDAHVKLVGKIEKHLGGDDYQFSDGTDSVIVEIDHDVWRGLTVGPEDTVEIYGEVDKDFFEFKIDVDKILKL